MSIDKDKIKHVSKLARISVDEKKIDALTKDLSSIFKFIEQLNELNTDKVKLQAVMENTSHFVWAYISAFRAATTKHLYFL